MQNDDPFAKYAVGTVAENKDEFARYAVGSAEKDEFLQYAVDAQPSNNPLSFNLQKALLNQGVDPETMKVFRSSADMGFFEKTWKSIKGGDAHMKMAWRMSMAAASDEDVFKQYREEEIIYEQALAANPIAQDKTNNIFEKAIFGAAESAAGMGYAMVGKLTTAALAAGTVATIATPAPGDEIIVGGAFITRLLGPVMAKKLLGKAAVTGTASLLGGGVPFYFQGKGDLYRDMRLMGVDHKTAQTWAARGAVPYAAIEFINDYIPGGKALSKFFPGLKSGAAPVISKTIGKAMLRMAGRGAWSTAKESSEEFFQELSNEVTKNIAADAGGVPEAKKSAWQIYTQSFDAMVQAIGPSMVLGGVSTVHHGAQQAQTSRAYNAIRDIHMAATGTEMSDTAALYATATLTGRDIKTLKGLTTKDQDAQLAGLLETLGEVDGRTVKMVNKSLEENTLTRPDAIEILESKNPRAAWLAFDYEGMKGVRQVNSEMEEIFKKKQEAATIVPKGDTDAGKAGVPDVTPPTIPTAAAAGKPVVAAKVDVIEPVADVQSQPIEPAPLDLEPDKVDASQTPDIPEAQAITPKPELPPKPIPPVQKEIDVEARKLFDEAFAYKHPDVKLDSPQAQEMWEATKGEAYSEAEYNLLHPTVADASTPKDLAGLSSPPMTAAQTGIPFYKIKTWEWNNRTYTSGPLLHHAQRQDVVELTPVEYNEVTGAYDTAGKTFQVTEVPENIRSVVAHQTDTEALNKGYAKYEETEKQVLDNVKLMLGKLGFEPLVAEGMAPNIKKKIMAATKQERSRMPGKVNVETLASAFEGIIINAQSDKPLIALGKNASEFTTVHELFHFLYNTVLKDVPYFKTGVDQWFDWLSGDSGAKKASAWRKTKVGREMMNDIEVWKKGGRKEFSEGMQEMLTMAVERSFANMSPSEGPHQRRTSKGSAALKKIYDAMPLSVRDTLNKLADILALTWRIIQSMRSKSKSTLYAQTNLPTTYAMDNHLRQLAYFDDFKGQNKQMVEQIETQAAESLNKHREQLKASYMALHNDGKLPHITEGVMSVARQIEQMVDNNIEIIVSMMVNASMMEVHEQQVSIVNEMVTHLASTSVVPSFVMETGKPQKHTTFLGDLASRISSANVFGIKMRSGKADMSSSAIERMFAEQLEAYWREHAVPKLYAKEVARKMFRERAAGEVWNSDTFENEALNLMRGMLIPKGLLRVLRESKGKGLAAKLMPYVLEHDGNRLETSWSTAAAIMRYINNNKENLMPGRMTFGVVAVSPTEAARGFEQGQTVDTVEPTVGKSLLPVHMNIIRELIANPELITLQTFWDIEEAIGGKAEDIIKDYVAIQLANEQIPEIVKADLRAKTKVALQRVAQARELDSAQFSRTKPTTDKLQKFMSAVNAAKLNEMGIDLIQNRIKDDADYGKYTPESLAYWQSLASTYLKGKTPAEAIAGLDTIEEEHVKLAVVMRLSNIASAQGDRTLSYSLAQAFADASLRFGRLGIALQEFYEKTAIGREMKINAIDEAMKIAGTLKKGLEIVRRLDKKAGALLEAAIKQLSGKDQRLIVGDALGDIDQKPRPSPKPTPEPNTVRVTIDNGLMGELRKGIAKAVRKAAAKAPANDVFFSASDPNTATKFDLGEALIPIVGNQYSSFFDTFQASNEKLIAAITSELEALHPIAKSWSAKNKLAAQKYIMSAVDSSSIETYEICMKFITSQGGIVTDKTKINEESNAEESNSDAEEGTLAEQLISKMEALAADKSGVIKPNKMELVKAIDVLMDVINDRALIKHGKKTKSLDNTAPQRFLADLSNDAEAIRDIWNEAQQRLKDAGIAAPSELSGFVDAVLGSPYANRQVTKALTGYMSWMSVKDYPTVLRNMIVDQQSGLLQQITSGIISSIAAGEITEAALQDAANRIAVKFSEHMSVNYGFAPDQVEALTANAKDQLMSWLRPQVEEHVNVAENAGTLLDFVVGTTKDKSFNINSRSGGFAKQIMTAFKLFNIVKRGSTSKNVDAVYKQLGLMMTNKDEVNIARANIVSEITKSINDALKSEHVPPELQREIGRLHTILRAIKNSEELSEFGRFPVFKTQIDSAINNTMSQYSKMARKIILDLTGEDRAVSITMRNMAHWSKATARHHIKTIRDAIMKKTGIEDEIAADQLARAISRRLFERLYKAREEQLRSLMQPPQDIQDKVSFMERVVKRISMGALETPEMAQELARYMGFGGLSETQRHDLLAMSRNIERRGDSVNAAFAKRRELPNIPVEDRLEDVGIATDQWHNSNEYRFMLKDFNKALANAAGYSNMDRATSIYFAFLLSGVSTHEVNIISTALQSLSHTAAQAWAIHIMDSEHTGRGMDFGGFMKSFAKWGEGFGKSLPSAWHLFKTGEAHGPASSEYASSTKHAPSVESGMFKGVLGTVVGQLKYITNALSAMDYAMAHANTTAMASVVARNRAWAALPAGASAYDLEIAEKLVAATMMQRVSKFDSANQKDVAFLRKELGRLKAKYGNNLDAMTYADLSESLDIMPQFATQAYFEQVGEEIEEGDDTLKAIRALSKMEQFKIYQRINELQFNALPETMKRDFVRSAGEATFNFSDDSRAHPTYENTIGTKMIRTTETMRQNLPAMRFIVPFVRIVGRVFDMSLDYSPAGFYRARQLHNRALTEAGTTITERDISTLKVKAWFGLASMTSVFAGALASMLGSGDDEDKDWFQLTGKGSSDRDKVNAWRERGGYGYQEFSIRMGNKWFSYRFTPLAIPFVWLGGMLDYLRYEMKLPDAMRMSPEEYKATEQSFSKFVVKSAIYGGMQSLPGMLEQTYMSSISDFLEIMSTPNSQVRQTKTARLIGRTASGFVAPNMFKQIYRTFDPSIYTVPEKMNGIIGEFLRDLPYMPPSWKKNVLLQRYNALGEPIRLNSPAIISSLIESAVRSRENRPANLGRFISVGRRTDPTWTWVAKNDVRIPSVSTSEQLLGIPMTDDIRQKYSRYRGKVLKNILDKMITSGKLDNISEAKAQKLVSYLSTRIGSAVKSALVTDRKLVQELIYARRPEIWNKFGISLPD